MTAKYIIEGRVTIDGDQIIRIISELLNSDANPGGDSMYLQGNEYVIIEVVRNGEAR